MGVAFIENGDSFSWNVIDRLPFARKEIAVLDGRDAAGCARALARCTAVVLGPGPRDPLRAGLVTLVQLAASRRLPLLGICLGHQALGLAYGAKLVQRGPVHGHVDTATFLPSPRFPGITGPQQVMRYHSLTLEEVAPPLQVIARNGAQAVMAIAHAELPMAGLQFHPDSYATPNGEQMIAAFFRSLA